MEMGRARQYAERVNLVKKIQHDGVWRFAPVAERHGKLLRDRVLISGREELHAEGSYYVEWYAAGQRRRLAVGRFEEALDAARRKSLEPNAIRAGIVQAAPTNGSTNSRTKERLTIGAAIDDYLDFVQHHRSPAPISPIATRSIPCCAPPLSNSISMRSIVMTSSIS
jgi:integrase/recombinase XerD